jgi:eukaryotic-like serine/threonine-protein kinase
VTSLGLSTHAHQNWIDCQLGSHNQLCPRPVVRPPEPQTPTKIGDVLYYPYLTATDKRGNSAQINMAVLSDRYEWELASADRIRLKGQNQTLPIAALKEELEKQGIFQIMENPNRIISLGTASCEGADTEEENRAMNRAKTIQEQLVKQLFQVREYRILNLGQFKRDNCQRNTTGTSFQRSLVIVGMRKETEGLIIKDAVYNRLSKTIKNFNLNDYSLGSVEKFDLK